MSVHPWHVWANRATHERNYKYRKANTHLLPLTENIIKENIITIWCHYFVEDIISFCTLIVSNAFVTWKNVTLLGGTFCFYNILFILNVTCHLNLREYSKLKVKKQRQFCMYCNVILNVGGITWLQSVFSVSYCDMLDDIMQSNDIKRIFT